MWQTLITLLVVVIALFFVGRKMYRGLRQAVNPSREISCGCSCCGCNTTCDTKKTNDHESCR